VVVVGEGHRSSVVDALGSGAMRDKSIVIWKDKAKTN